MRVRYVECYEFFILFFHFTELIAWAACVHINTHAYDQSQNKMEDFYNPTDVTEGGLKTLVLTGLYDLEK